MSRSMRGGVPTRVPSHARGRWMSHPRHMPKVAVPQPDSTNFPACITYQAMGRLQVSIETQCFEYKYEPLKRPTEIRLMKLDMPAKSYPDILREKPIVCDILHVALESAPQYTAISYVWGDMTDTKLVSLTAGHHMSVSKSLYSAVNALRSKPEVSQKPLYVWADQICINQSDNEERGKQVGLMGSIYSKAQCTIVWLDGYTDEFARPCFHFIHILSHISLSVSSAYHVFYKTDVKAFERKLAKSAISPEDLKTGAAAIEKLSRDTWFTRLWTVQEFVISPKVEFFCASERCSHLDLLRALFVARWRLNLSTTGMYHASALWSYYDALHRKSRKPHLLQLLDGISDSAYECKLPHDRIYALLALQSAPLPIPVDYSLPIPDLLVRVAAAILRDTRSLAPLARRICHHPSSTPSRPAAPLPSWAQDWTITTFQYHLNDRRVDFAAGGRGRPYVFRSPEDGVISARGRTVVVIEEIFAHEFCRGSLRDGEYGEFLGAETLIPAAMGRLLGRKICRYAGADVVEGGGKGEGIDLATAAAKAKAKAAWLLAMTFTGGRYANVCPSEFDPRKGRLPELIARGKVSDLRSLGKCKGRKLAMLASERTPIGLVPDCAEVGDEICVLEGSDTPLVLRRKGDRWINRGEGYVHGIMHGEAVDWEEGKGEEFWIE